MHCLGGRVGGSPRPATASLTLPAPDWTTATASSRNRIESATKQRGVYLVSLMNKQVSNRWRAKGSFKIAWSCLDGKAKIGQLYLYMTGWGLQKVSCSHFLAFLRTKL